MTEGCCLCGDVRFAADGFASGVFKCHCSKCRRAFGGASSAAVLVPESAFRWVQGSQGISEYRAASGFLRRFCERCGGIVPQHLPDHGLYWIPAGLLESNPRLRLTRHIHVASKADWEILDPDTPCLPEGFDREAPA